MAKRVNLQDKPLVKNLEEADATMARIAELNRHITLINTGLNDDMARLQLAANDQLSPLQKEKELLEHSLYFFLTGNKSTLFTDKQRSRALSFGTVGMATLPGELVPIGNTPVARVIALLREQNLESHIRTKPELNKETLITLDPAILKNVRLRVKGGEKPYYRLVDHATEGAA